MSISLNITENKLYCNDNEYVVVKSISELEDLYTKGVITYWQYLNLKERLQNDDK